MISKQQWRCPNGLIERALADYPILDESAVLNDPTGAFFYDEWIIKEIYKDTPWEKILKTLPVKIGQARIIRLQPGESYMAHADIDDRYHLNLNGNQSFLIDISNQHMHPTVADNFWYEMDAGRIHSATNYGEIVRTQLVVRKLLQHSILEKKIHVSISPKVERHDYRYQFDNIISPWLNSMNKMNRIDNFQFTGELVEFDTEEKSIFDLINFDKNIFAITYEF